MVEIPLDTTVQTLYFFSQRVFVLVTRGTQPSVSLWMHLAPISGSAADMNQAPIITPFCQTGFTFMEWGISGNPYHVLSGLLEPR